MLLEGLVGLVVGLLVAAGIIVIMGPSRTKRIIRRLRAIRRPDRRAA